MNRERLCQDIFYEIEDLEERCNLMKDKIAIIKFSVQNPSHIQSENFTEVSKMFLMIKNDMDMINEELKRKYEEIYEVYMGE